MMAFQDGFVVSVICDGKPLRELSEGGRRVCRIPFGSEYKLRLKNKTSVRALAQISIDGTDVIMHGKGVCINPGEDLDIERFLESLTEGKCFKFVEASSAGVQDPTSRENGLIQVKFFREVPEPIRRKSILRSNSLRGAGGQGMSGQSCDVGHNYLNANVSSNNIEDGMTLGRDVGATVEGSVSTQQFVEGTAFRTNPVPVTVDIWLKGPTMNYNKSEGDAHSIEHGWRVNFVRGLAPQLILNGRVLDEPFEFKLGQLTILPKEVRVTSE